MKRKEQKNRIIFFLIAFFAIVILISIISCMEMWVLSAKKNVPYTIVETGTISEIYEDDFLLSDNNKIWNYVIINDLIFRAKSLKDYSKTSETIKEKDFVYVLWIDYADEYLFFKQKPTKEQIKSAQKEILLKPITISVIWICFLLMNLIYICIQRKK